MYICIYLYVYVYYIYVSFIYVYKLIYRYYKGDMNTHTHKDPLLPCPVFCTNWEEEEENKLKKGRKERKKEEKEHLKPHYQQELHLKNYISLFLLLVSFCLSRRDKR